MRITWLLEQADQIWGGIKVVLEDANWLAARGHQVTVLSKSGPPAWMALRCQFRRVPDFGAANLPEADLLIGTFWPTMPSVAAADSRCGAPVHFCQGYEGDFPENAALRERIEAVYRLPGMHHIAISPHVATLLQRRFGLQARAIPNAIDHAVHFPGAARQPNGMLRVGLVGPMQVPWKDLATGIDACRLAVAAGQPLQLVRVTNTQPDPSELELPFPVEWHQRVAPRQMGDIYRSLDVFLGTSSGAEEGFHLPAVEAMACGVPCVLTEVPCFQAHGDSQYALFVPPRDPAAMAEALVIAGHMDDVRQSLRTAGIAAASRYTQQAHGQALEQALLAIAVQDRATRRHGLRAVPIAPMTVTQPNANVSNAPKTANSPSNTNTNAPSSAPIAPARAATKAAPTPAPATVAPTAAAQLDRLEQQLQEALRTGADEALDQGDPERADRLRRAAQCLAGARPNVIADPKAWPATGGADTETALRQLDAQLAMRGDDPQLHERRGLLLADSGRDLEAAQAFRAAIAVGGAGADAYNNLGVVLFQAGDLAGARRSFERALTLEPEHEDALANLADLPAA